MTSRAVGPTISAATLEDPRIFPLHRPIHDPERVQPSLDVDGTTKEAEHYKGRVTART